MDNGNSFLGSVIYERTSKANEVHDNDVVIPFDSFPPELEEIGFVLIKVRKRLFHFNIIEYPDSSHLTHRFENSHMLMWVH